MRRHACSPLHYRGHLRRELLRLVNGRAYFTLHRGYFIAVRTTARNTKPLVNFFFRGGLTRAKSATRYKSACNPLCKIYLFFSPTDAWTFPYRLAVSVYPQVIKGATIIIDDYLVSWTCSQREIEKIQFRRGIHLARNGVAWIDTSCSMPAFQIINQRARSRTVRSTRNRRNVAAERDEAKER